MSSVGASLRVMLIAAVCFVNVHTTASAQSMKMFVATPHQIWPEGKRGSFALQAGNFKVRDIALSDHAACVLNGNDLVYFDSSFHHSCTISLSRTFKRAEHIAVDSAQLDRVFISGIGVDDKQIVAHYRGGLPMWTHEIANVQALCIGSAHDLLCLVCRDPHPQFPQDRTLEVQRVHEDGSIDSLCSTATFFPHWSGAMQTQLYRDGSDLYVAATQGILVYNLANKKVDTSWTALPNTQLVGVRHRSLYWNGKQDNVSAFEGQPFFWSQLGFGLPESFQIMVPEVQAAVAPGRDDSGPADQAKPLYLYRVHPKTPTMVTLNADSRGFFLTEVRLP